MTAPLTDRPHPAPGHRERKKLRTRQALVDAARALYVERGLDGVTIAEIARRADVAPRTFFSYFESKEDVFLGPGDVRIEMLINAIRARAHGEPILASVQRVLRRESPRTDPEDRSGLTLSELLVQPAIAERLRERWIKWEEMLAEAIAEEVGARPGDPEPRVVAAALTGAIRIAAGAVDANLGERQKVATRAFKILAEGLSSYGA